jgi:hypothetical protein
VAKIGNFGFFNSQPMWSRELFGNFPQNWPYFKEIL